MRESVPDAPLRWRFGDSIAAGLIVLLHFLVAVWYKECAGLTIVTDPPFDSTTSWHIMPFELLRTDLLKTLWLLHAQPPLHNVWCAIFARLSSHPVEAVYYPQIMLGALTSGMVYVIVRQLLHCCLSARIIAFLLALNPAIFVFEASMGYEIHTAFLGVLSLFFLALYYGQKDTARSDQNPTRTPLVYLSGFVFAINLLIMTRSLYQPVFLLVIIPFTCLLAGDRWRKMLVIALILCLPVAGWCVKNQALFGFWGTGSYGGSSLWTIVSANYDREDLQGFIDEGIIDETVLAVLVWRKPYEYREHGFSKQSPHEALSGNRGNNINIVDISQMYKRNALRLLRHRPLHYVVNVAKAFRIYCLPTSRTKYVLDNANRMGGHEAIVSQGIQGQFFTRLLSPLFGGKDPFFSFWFFVIPGTFAAYAVYLVRRCGTAPAAWHAYLQTDGLLLFAALFVAYTTLISCMLEFGENGRLKFATEPILWPFVIAVAYRTLRRTS